MYLSIVHVRELRCDRCGAVVAPAGARSFVVDRNGLPAAFDSEGPPEEMNVEIACPNGHAIALAVPGDVSAEETLVTPDEAPIAADAALIEV